MVANTVYSEIAYDLRRADLEHGPFRTDFSALAADRELWNLLTLRLELELGLQDALVELDRRASSVLDVLQR